MKITKRELKKLIEKKVNESFSHYISNKTENSVKKDLEDKAFEKFNVYLYYEASTVVEVVASNAETALEIAKTKMKPKLDIIQKDIELFASNAGGICPTHKVYDSDEKEILFEE